jgi:hypothetical protein
VTISDEDLGLEIAIGKSRIEHATKLPGTVLNIKVTRTEDPPLDNIWRMKPEPGAFVSVFLEGYPEWETSIFINTGNVYFGRPVARVANGGW